MQPRHCLTNLRSGGVTNSITYLRNAVVFLCLLALSLSTVTEEICSNRMNVPFREYGYLPILWGSDNLEFPLLILFKGVFFTIFLSHFAFLI